MGEHQVPGQLCKCYRGRDCFQRQRRDAAFLPQTSAEQGSAGGRSEARRAAATPKDCECHSPGVRQLPAQEQRDFLEQQEGLPLRGRPARADEWAATPVNEHAVATSSLGRGLCVYMAEGVLACCERRREGGMCGAADTATFHSIIDCLCLE